MTVFVDTSAILAVLDAGDRNHLAAAREWRRMNEERMPRVTSSLVVVETFALVQRRAGVAAVRTLNDVLMPVIDVIWLGGEEYAAAVDAVLPANRRNLSIVDCASFALARRLRVEAVFAFDEQFAEQGFVCVPSTPG